VSTFFVFGIAESSVRVKVDGDGVRVCVERRCTCSRHCLVVALVLRLLLLPLLLLVLFSPLEGDTRQRRGREQTAPVNHMGKSAN